MRGVTGWGSLNLHKRVGARRPAFADANVDLSNRRDATEDLCLVWNDLAPQPDIDIYPTAEIGKHILSLLIMTGTS